MGKKEKKVKSPESVGFKEIFGATALSTNNGLAAIFMSTMFMVYMTDYAGLGEWGATLATALLLGARFIDAFDDPIQGAIMDSAKITKHGKYKPFFMLSILMTGIGTIALYSLPDAITKTPWLVTVWVIFFYFVYDIGTSFYNQNLLFRTMTSDPEERSKLLVGPRLWVMVLGMFGSGMTAIVVSIQAATGSYKTAYMILALVAMGISCIVSILGWLMVKEKHVVEQDEDEKVRFSDIFELLKKNKAILVNFFKDLFSGFIWTFLFAAPTYYVKYAYCTDLTTGVVDYAKLGSMSIIVSLMMLFPLLIGTIVATPILKAFKGDFIKMQRFDFAMQGLGGLFMFICQCLGVLQKNPVLFFISMFIMATFIGIDFIPGSNIGMEIMDYTIYKTGKDRSALTSALGGFLMKAQSALSSALVGGILMAIGYRVDSVTGDYIGDLANMPTLLTGMVFVIGLLPAIMALCSILVSLKYPIDQEERKKIQEYIAEHQSKKVEE
ncbi:MAG: MFS transporter [Erysipelotrichaceae bacterium]|nr:MFS transporter [Erysipelotrichaceae bacterium]